MKHTPFNVQKNKINTITEQTVEVSKTLTQLQKYSELESSPATDFYKKAKLIYTSDWVNAELEKIPSAVSTTYRTLLPERALYNFTAQVPLVEEFIPYTKIELLIKTNPDTPVVGVFPYVSTSYREIQFLMYEWHGITFHSTSCATPIETRNSVPQPTQAYDITYYPCEDSVPGHSAGFLFPLYTPVPLGVDPTHVVPVGMNIVGYENRLIYNLGGGLSESYWTAGATVYFHQLDDSPYNIPLEYAQDFIEQYYENVIFSDNLPNYKGSVGSKEELPLTGNTIGDTWIVFSTYYQWGKEEADGTIDDWKNTGVNVFPTKAYEFRQSNQVETGHQQKKWIKNAENNYTLEVKGDVLLISPARELVPYSVLIPTYQPKGGDIQFKLNIYSINPNYYSERKQYTNGK